MANPDYNAYLLEIWGYPGDVSGWLASDATNIVVGGNPPYTFSDFLAMYPKFFGTPTAIAATLDGTSATITGLNSTQNLKPFQLVTGTGIPAGTLVVSVNSTAKSAVLSNATTAAGTDVQLTVYAAPPMPLVAMQIYINLASASLMSARWLDMWPMAMALYIAHYCTLYLRSESGPNQTAAQIASSGLERGIAVSKSAGGVSTSAQLLGGLEDWAAWTSTTYGTQFATFAKTVGSGAMVVL
jgi:hypothetical protein